MENRVGGNRTLRADAALAAGRHGGGDDAPLLVAERAAVAGFFAVIVNSPAFVVLPYTEYGSAFVVTDTTFLPFIFFVVTSFAVYFNPVGRPDTVQPFVTPGR